MCAYVVSRSQTASQVDVEWLIYLRTIFLNFLKAVVIRTVTYAFKMRCVIDYRESPGLEASIEMYTSTRFIRTYEIFNT